jgi:hypothetical protein
MPIATDAVWRAAVPEVSFLRERALAFSLDVDVASYLPATLRLSSHL